LFLQLSLRTSNQDASQRDLRSFFSPVSHTRSFLSTCASKKEECVKTDPTHHVELVSVVDSDDDDDNGLSSVRNDAENHYSDRSPGIKGSWAEFFFARIKRRVPTSLLTSLFSSFFKRSLGIRPNIQ